MVEVPGSEQILPADLVLLAMGFVSPVGSILEAFGGPVTLLGYQNSATRTMIFSVTQGPRLSISRSDGGSA